MKVDMYFYFVFLNGINFIDDTNIFQKKWERYAQTKKDHNLSSWPIEHYNGQVLVMLRY